MCAAKAAAVSLREAKTLFADLADTQRLLLAVSGGPDSTALLWLAARWRASLRRGPELLAVTIDHALRAESGKEAAAVKRFARALGIEHRTLRWSGSKPKSGLQEAARQARYRLLAEAANKAGARHVLTGHTRDDQAETLLMRLARGSGLSGLAAMARVSPLPVGTDILLVRPLLEIPKARLIVTLRKGGVGFAEDPSNMDPRFTRSRLREILPALEQEGLSPERLSLLARRMRRADIALEAAVESAVRQLAISAPSDTRIVFDATGFARLPAEIALRLLGLAVTRCGDERPVALAKLEGLLEALYRARFGQTLRRTLAGALVSNGPEFLVVERAPPRRARRG